MTTDDSYTMYAAGYDADGNYINDVSVTWGVTGSLDAPPSGPGTSTTFAPSTAGTSGTITADDGNGHTDSTGTITVNVGSFDHVLVTDSPGGTEVNTYTMTTDDSYTMYASGYDADGNYTGLVNVTWRYGTGGVFDEADMGGSVGVDVTGTSVTFDPDNTGSDTIWADVDGDGTQDSEDDATGVITVNVGSLDHIVIRDAAGGGGNEVTTHSMTADETFTVYAAGYDSDGNYISDVNVTWNVTGTLDNTGFPISGVSSITYDPNSAGSGTITADAGGGIIDTTDTITVTAGVIASFTISAPASVTAGVPFTVTVTNAQDSGGNLANGTVTVTWLSSDDGVQNSPNGTSPNFNQITVTNGSGSAVQTLFRSDTNVILQGDAGGGVTAQTGSITVSHGELGYFDISENTNTPTVSTPVTITITAYDKYGNRWNNSIPVNDITLTASGADDVTANLIWDWNNSDPDLIDNADLTGTLRGSLNGGTWQFDANGQYIVTLGYEKAFDAIVPEVLATENNEQQSGYGNPVTWQPGAASQFVFVESVPATVTAGQNFYIKVEACDTFGNLATSYNGSATFSDTGPDGVVFLTSQNDYTDSSITFTNGAWEGYLRTDTSIINNVNRAGNQAQLQLTDGSITDTTNNFTVTAGPLHHFHFSGIGTYVRANDQISVTIDAMDQYGNYTDFTGNVSIKDMTGTIYEFPNTTDTTITFTSQTVGGYTVGRYTGDFVITQSFRDDFIIATDPATGATGSSNTFSVVSDEVIVTKVSELAPKVALAGSTVNIFEIRVANVDPTENVDLTQLRFYVESGKDGNRYTVLPNTLVDAVYVTDTSTNTVYSNESIGLGSYVSVDLGSGITLPSGTGEATFLVRVKIKSDISSAVVSNMILRVGDVIGEFTTSHKPVSPADEDFNSIKEEDYFIESDIINIKEKETEAAYNYPNPFNPRSETTNIVFYNSVENGSVYIKIYTITGRLVRDLSLRTAQPKGSIEVEWDGRNGRGQVVRNGVYVAVIRLKNGKKMMVKIAVVK